MRRIIVSFIAAAALIFAGTSEPHRTICGHSSIYWTVTSPTSGATIKYREKYSGWYGNHYHRYLTQYFRDTTANDYWATVHEHIRACSPVGH